jgi:hypothetical protein
VNADSIGTAVSLRQDDSKTVKSHIAIERYGIFAIMILFFILFNIIISIHFQS